MTSPSSWSCQHAANACNSPEGDRGVTSGLGRDGQPAAVTSTPREPAASASTSTTAAPSTASSTSSYSQPLASETTAANLRTSAWSPAAAARPRGRLPMPDANMPPTQSRRDTQRQWAHRRQVVHPARREQLGRRIREELADRSPSRLVGIRGDKHCCGHPPKRPNGDVRLDEPPAGSHDRGWFRRARARRWPMPPRRPEPWALVTISGDPRQALDGVHPDARYRRGAGVGQGTSEVAS